MTELLYAVLIMASTCSEGYIARHDAFDQVFRNYPERESACPTCDGHFAAICADYPIGTVLRLYAGGDMVKVVVSDCAAAGDIPFLNSRNRIGDLAIEEWRELELPDRTVKAYICKDKAR